jgi:hypothetical protein
VPDGAAAVGCEVGGSWWEVAVAPLLPSSFRLAGLAARAMERDWIWGDTVCSSGDAGLRPPALPAVATQCCQSMFRAQVCQSTGPLQVAPTASDAPCSGSRRLRLLLLGRWNAPTSMEKLYTLNLEAHAHRRQRLVDLEALRWPLILRRRRGNILVGDRGVVVVIVVVAGHGIVIENGTDHIATPGRGLCEH